MANEGRDPQPLKTETSHRPIDLPPPLRRMLLDMPQRSEAGLVFPAVMGGHISYSFFHKSWPP